MFPGGQFVVALMILLGCSYLVIGLLAFFQRPKWRKSARIALYSWFVSIPLGGILLPLMTRMSGHMDEDRWIQVALGTPLPNGIRNLQGAGSTWQGFSGYFRFRLESKEMQGYLTANRCTKVSMEDLEECAQDFLMPDRYEKFFTPKWNPEFNGTKECYFRRFSSHTTTILICRDSDWVYLVSRGPTSPGPTDR